MQNWIGYVLPLSPREENIPELSYAWSLHYALQKGFLFAGWNSLQINGATNMLQRGYWVLVPVVISSFITSLSVDTVYKLFVGGLLIFSGLGMTQFLRRARLSTEASLIGGLLYLLAPPHLAIAIEGFEFNVYWMIIPWIIYCIEHFIQTGAFYRNAVAIAFLAMVALPAGNTYFVSTMPIFVIYILIRLFFSKREKKLQFLITTGVFFITCSAWLIIPSAFEFNHSWIVRESTRRKVVNLPTPQQLLELFPKRLKKHSVLAFDYKHNFTDMSWYVGISTIILASGAFIRKKKHNGLMIPLAGLVFIFIPGLLLKTGLFKPFVIQIIKIIPLQAAYDQTFRMFLFPVFGLSGLGAIGAETLMQKTTGRKKLILAILFITFILWDFHLYKDFFKSIPQAKFDIEGKIIAELNPKDDQNRYWAPFPYVWHLPRYREEYMTRYTFRNRVNSSFLYIPFAPLYSEHLYDVLFTTALEPEKFDPEFLNIALQWANTGFIILQPEVRDYSHVVNGLAKYGFTIYYQSPDLIILKQNKFDTYVQTHSKISLVPFEKKDDIYYWFDLVKQGITPFFTDQPLFFNISDREKNELIEWKRENPTTILVTTAFTQPTLVSLSESFYPGWSVNIDQKPYQLLRTNYAFMGTIVPSGNHLVRFTYQKPWYYSAGLLISLATFGIMFMLKYTRVNRQR